MDIWIIQDGEKTGPVQDFEIRRRIEIGELSASTPVWHEGLDAWRPLGEIGLFTREFEKPATPTGIQGPALAPNGAVPTPLPGQAFVFRRFWARWFDLYLFGGVWWIAMWYSGRDIGGVLNNHWIILLHYVPWFVIEAVLIHRFGTTPGKWLLGIRVLNDDGTLLGLQQAVRRSFRVLFVGLGFGWGLLSAICQIMSLITTRRLGRPLWDHSGGHRLSGEPLDPIRITGYVWALFVALSLQCFVLWPHALEEAGRKDPALRERWEKFLVESFGGNPRSLEKP
jgi:uncharacterized RDD family membrane protein YckC